MWLNTQEVSPNRQTVRCYCQAHTLLVFLSKLDCIIQQYVLQTACDDYYHVWQVVVCIFVCVGSRDATGTSQYRILPLRGSVGALKTHKLMLSVDSVQAAGLYMSDPLPASQLDRCLGLQALLCRAQRDLLTM